MSPYVLVLAALALGALAGLVFRSVLRAEPEEGGDASLGLEQRAERALEQLRELAGEQAHYDPTVFAAEKNRLERDAAKALQAREQYARPRTAIVRAPTFSSRHPMAAGAIYGGGVVAFLALLFFAVVDAGRDRSMPAEPTAVTSANDPRYDALLMLAAISLEYGDAEQLLQAWQLYMRQTPPRKRPPQLKRAVDWLEKRVSE